MAGRTDDLVQSLPSVDEDDLDAELVDRVLLEMYERQVLARTFDEKAISLHRQGRIGTYAPMRGQEAAQVGAAMALQAVDYLFPTYRDHAMYLTRGIGLTAVLRHLMGRGNYVDRADPDECRTFPPTIPIATQLPHAVGVGMAADYCGDEVVAMASLGDGATSEGDFHEALNIAGVFDAPVVFLCQNNGYAISVPQERQTASATIVQKADAYGIEGTRVDGNDVLAVFEAVTEAVTRARDGNGPTLIEAVTYRQGPHTTTDDPQVYRDETEGDGWEDPLTRTRTSLESRLGWTDADDRVFQEAARATVMNAVETAEAEPDPDTQTIFDNVYATDHPRYKHQRTQLSEGSDSHR